MIKKLIKVPKTTLALCLVCVLFLTAASWRLWVNYGPTIKHEALSLSLELSLVQHIGDKILETSPEATGLEFYDLKSEIINTESAKVMFDYKFSHPLAKDDMVDVRLQGWAMLSKTNGKTWSLDKFQIVNESVEYLKGTRVVSST